MLFKEVNINNSQFAVAIHILTLLSLPTEEPLTSELIGASVNTNPVYIRRILGMLREARLVSSTPGVGGGWRALQPPEKINLLTVYKAVDESHPLSMHHRPPNPDCLVGRNIQHSLEGIFREAELALEGVLANQTLAQVLESVVQDRNQRAS